ncbi:MAG TPA: 30S ribosomal protein S9 [Candidatus Paceibacterota bacterium]|nr:30S ribosomal protein S9 [Candidatus Paceibacterota bacterium]
MTPRKPAQPKKSAPAKKEAEEIVVDSDMDVTAPVFEAETDAKSGKEKYYEAVGRRKESIARVRLFTKKSTDAADEEKALVTVNDKNYTDYFSDVNLQYIVESPLRKLKSLNRFKATVVVNGGGIAGQAGAIKHGIARALVLFDLNFRKKLKKSQFLMRDPRAKERRKYGLKKARKSPQWNKR